MQRRDSEKKKEPDNSWGNFSASITTISFMLLLCGLGKARFKKLKRKDFITNVLQATLITALQG